MVKTKLGLLPLIAVVAGLWTSAPTRLLSADEASLLPNIVLVMADDMGMGDTSAYQDITRNSDADQLDTPNMERLARMGIRFTDAHTPSSRCTATRYGLLTGRYAWRNRLKHWVLFGAQGDPMIEADRPTIASLLHESGYRTAMVGKWHVGLRYRQRTGKPAAGWQDADLTQPLFDCPLDHGFDFAWYTSRSHGTSGPNAGTRIGTKESSRTDSVENANNRGPGHLDGRRVIGATGQGKTLIGEGPDAYILKRLGSRHSDHAMSFLRQHVSGDNQVPQPFFLYYACNANHGPYTPDDHIADMPIAGAARTKSGQRMKSRYDFIFENDVALGRVLDWLENTKDPRRPGRMLMDNTLVIFTSDNGAEIRDKTATGPFRSHKGSVFEGGHRVPFIASWPHGNVGDGLDSTGGSTNSTTVCLTDLFATFTEIVGQELPALRRGEKGGEDSLSMLTALHGAELSRRYPLLINDHNQAPGDKAMVALRSSSPEMDGKKVAGQWKLFFDAELIRFGRANPVALYELSDDPLEQRNLLAERDLRTLIGQLSTVAEKHRNLGGHRYSDLPSGDSFQLDFADAVKIHEMLDGQSSATISLSDLSKGAEALEEVTVTIRAEQTKTSTSEANAIPTFNIGENGLGISGNASQRVDGGEAVWISFNRDVLLESAWMMARDGSCGGYYQLADQAPLAIYCIDADNDAKDQHGILSDLGVITAGKNIRFDSSSHFGVEPAGSWHVRRIAGRILVD